MEDPAVTLVHVEYACALEEREHRRAPRLEGRHPEEGDPRAERLLVAVDALRAGVVARRWRKRALDPPRRDRGGEGDHWRRLDVQSRSSFRCPPAVATAFNLPGVQRARTGCADRSRRVCLHPLDHPRDVGGVPLPKQRHRETAPLRPPSRAHEMDECRRRRPDMPVARDRPPTACTRRAVHLRLGCEEPRRRLQYPLAVGETYP
mmetsp:Transcript_14810/g.31395  ORF Transcript_14810/g.31395 Transcript_14810/m.31395 type:complete len:205 (+) Transcript_14810:266-880(+)